jgi:hydrogenase-4 component E
MSHDITSIPFLDTVTMALLATGLAMVGSRRIDRAIRMVTLQAFLTSLLVTLIGYSTGDWHLYLVAVVTFLVKGIAAPGILLFVLKRITSKIEVEMFVGRTSSLVLACGLILIAYYVTGPFVELGAPRIMLSVSLALLLIGLFMMVTRKTALMQVLGFMLMENGVFMTAVSTTLGMPLVVEMGIFLDVLVGVGIMGLLSHRINDKFASIETTKLNSLKG